MYRSDSPNQSHVESVSGMMNDNDVKALEAKILDGIKNSGKKVERNSDMKTENNQESDAAATLMELANQAIKTEVRSEGETNSEIITNQAFTE